MSKAMWSYATPGIPDQLFNRASGIPMTKQEIRAIIISQLRLFPTAVVYDVGAGTGSVTVECALQAKAGTVYALEKNGHADELVETNARRFGLTNVKLVPGEASKTMAKLPPADRIFIGGSAGALSEILQTAHRKLKPGGFLVATAVTLETGPVVLDFMNRQGYQQVSAVAVNVAKLKQVGSSHLWQAENPVQVMAGQKPGCEK